MTTLARKAARVEPASDKELVVQGMITTEDVDSDYEVILADGADFERAEKHLPLLAGHNAHDPRQAIGKLRRGPVRKGNGWFASFAVHPSERDLYEKARDGILQFSIGFDRLEYSAPTDEEKAKWPKAEIITRKWSLVEVSLVSVPANENALLEDVKSYRIHPKKAAWLMNKPQDDLTIVLDAGVSVVLDSTTNIVLE